MESFWHIFGYNSGCNFIEKKIQNNVMRTRQPKAITYYLEYWQQLYIARMSHNETRNFCCLSSKRMHHAHQN